MQRSMETKSPTETRLGTLRRWRGTQSAARRRRILLRAFEPLPLERTNMKKASLSRPAAAGLEAIDSVAPSGGESRQPQCCPARRQPGQPRAEPTKRAHAESPATPN